MLFNSYIFIFAFLPIAMLVFFGLARLENRSISLGWLVAASLFFYAWWAPIYVTLILASVAVNYSLGLVLMKATAHRKALLVGGIAANLGVLGYFKYANFFVENLRTLTGATIDLPPIILPLAISFFTFQQIAYLVDTYKGETKEHNFLHYCLFITFFPQLIAGPIVHHKEMLPQFMKKTRAAWCSKDFSVGLTIFFIGLFKKVVLADNVAVYANAVFGAADSGVTIHFVEAWAGALAYTFQLYFDFSGYSDMAIGLGRLFGIRLPLNFNSPYKATSIADFWHRWHMTLSRFLREYLYIPLGGNRKGPVRRYVNLLLTMLLGGLWHGAGWTFVVWGGLHGLYLTINHGFSSFKKKRGIEANAGGWFAHEAARATTFLAVVVAWVFFRATTFDGASSILSGMVGLNGVVLPTALAGLPLQATFASDWLGHASSPLALAWIVVLALAARFAPNTQEVMIDHGPAFETRAGEIREWTGRLRWKWQPSYAWGLALAVLSLIALDAMRQVSDFLYFQF